MDNGNYSNYRITSKTLTAHNEVSVYNYSKKDPSSSIYPYIQSGSIESLISNYYHRRSFPNIELYYNHTFVDNLPVPVSVSILQNVETSSQKLIDSHHKKSINPPFRSSFPIAVRYISSSNTFYIERPPFQIDAEMYLLPSSKISHKSKKLSGYKIWIPWTISVFNPSNPLYFQIFFSDSQLSTMEDLYVPCILPNTYSSTSNICFGNSAEDFIDINNINSDSDIKYIYSSLFNEYMNGGWNIDLPSNLSFYIHSYYSALSENLISSEKFPTLHKFFCPTKEYLTSHLPKAKKTLIDSFLSNRANSYNSKYLYKYIIIMLSTFTLEETLSFYQELSSLSISKKLTFQSILDFTPSLSTPSESTSYYNAFVDLYQTSANNILTALDQHSASIGLISPNHNTYRILDVNVIVHFPDNDNKVYTSFQEIPDNLLHSFFKRILNAYKENLFNFETVVLHYYIETNTFQVHQIDSSHNFDKYYFNYILSSYTKLEEPNLQETLQS
jgi:hypothetical protein